MAQGTVSTRLQRLEAKAGDSIFIPSGLVHALGAPGLVYEIQQNADTTYRLDDWGRTDKHGTPENSIANRPSPACNPKSPLPASDVQAAPRPSQTPLVPRRRNHTRTGRSLPPRRSLPFRHPHRGAGNTLLRRPNLPSGDFLLLPAHAAPCTAGEHGATLLITTVPPTCP